MPPTILRLLSLMLTAFRRQSELALENLALRQLYDGTGGQNSRYQIGPSAFSCREAWMHWKETLVIVKSETVLRWHRKRLLRMTVPPE